MSVESLMSLLLLSSRWHLGTSWADTAVGVQVAGTVEIGVGAHFEGVALCSTAINMKTGATMNGRLLAQTAVTLQMNTVTQPAL